MQVDLDVVSDVAVDERLIARLTRLFQFAGRHYLCQITGTWQVTIRLSGDAEIAELHREFFDDPTPTDVISFPSGESLAARGGYLGDIAISMDTAREQSREYGHHLLREVAYLALHGLLHLCGYDDSSDDARLEMLALQDEIMRAFDTATDGCW